MGVLCDVMGVLCDVMGVLCDGSAIYRTVRYFRQ